MWTLKDGTAFGELLEKECFQLSKVLRSSSCSSVFDFPLLLVASMN